MTPVYFGSALKNYGVRDLIEAFCDFGPSRATSRPMPAWWRRPKTG